MKISSKITFMFVIILALSILISSCTANSSPSQAVSQVTVIPSQTQQIPFAPSQTPQPPGIENYADSVEFTIQESFENGIDDHWVAEKAVWQDGQVQIKGDSTCAYYWNKHEQTKDTIQGQWIRTGDKYYRDEDGYLWYQGRSDDMLKVGGIWVSPIEIENCLIEHPAVLESGVVGVADKENLIKHKAYIMLKEGYEGSDELTEELKKFVKEKIGVYKFPRWIEFVTELPKTATGKTQRYKLRE